MKKLINWKLYGILMVMVVVSTILGQPAITKMSGQELTWKYLLTYALPLNTGISLLGVFLGLFLGKKMGMGVPIIESWVKKENVSREKIRFTFIYAPVIGLAISLITIALSFIPSPVNMEGNVSNIVPTAFESLLSSFYGGIFEEISMRLFIMTCYAWFVSFIISLIRRKGFRPSKIALWISILLAGVAFGAAHLVTAAQMFTLTPPVVIKVLLGNGIPGIVFGYLYWKKGLEASMTAHFTGDIVMHVIPLIFI